IIKIARINPLAYPGEIGANLETIERKVTLALDLLHLIDRPGAKVSFDVNAALAGIVKDFRNYGTGKIALKESYAPEPLRISADPVQISEIVLNLLTNAYDSIGDQPGGEIIITTGRREPQGNVFIRVEDNGKGIPPAHVPYIFDSYF